MKAAIRSGNTINGKQGNNITIQDLYGTNVDDYDNIQGSDITQNDLSLNYNLYTAGDVSFNSKLFINGDASFNSDLRVGGDLYANYPDTSIPSSAITFSS